MNNTLIKKIIIVTSSLLVLVGVSIFAYWMSELNAPDEEKEDVTIVIGIGAATGTDLNVIKIINDEGYLFVPKDRTEEDVIDNNPISEYIFEVEVKWEYTPIRSGERGVLKIDLEEFVFFDEEENKLTNYLTSEQQQILKSSFKVSLTDKLGNEPSGHYLIDPFTVKETQPIYIKVEFIEDVKDIDVWELIKGQMFAFKILIVVEQVIIP